MFNLMLHIDISDGRPGMLVPIFSSPQTNIPYVQQMDEFLQVREVIPFLEYENYSIVGAEHRQSISEGDNGLISFRSFDGSIICGDFEAVSNYIAANKASIAANPILRSQLNRIEGTEFTPSFEVWRRVADAVFTTAEQRKIWVDSEMQLFQKQKKIWTEIDTREFEPPAAAVGGLGAPISELSTEFLIHWLGTRSNFLARDWTKVWHYVNERRHFDDRLAQTAISWMFFLGAENQDLSQSKSVLLALLEREKSFEAGLPGLGEFLSDRFSTEPSLVFSFLRPRRFFSLLMTFLARTGDVEEVLNLIKFCTLEIEKEQYMITALADALSLIGAQTKRTEDKWVSATHNREFEHKQTELAEAIQSILEPLIEEAARGDDGKQNVS